jgi:hypothetical protein
MSIPGPIMPPASEQRLQTIRKATRACRDTPGRTGRFVQLQDVDEVMVAGDLHGNLDNLRRILQAADLVNHPRRHLILQEVIHGPQRYPSGGDKSHQLLELVAALKVQFPRQFHFLLGNHELAQFTGRRIGKTAGEDSATGPALDLNERFRLGVETAHGERAGEIYAALEEFIGAVPVALRTPGRIFFSHSLPSFGHLPDFQVKVLQRDPSSPADLAPCGPIYGLVWGRDVRPDTVAAFLRAVDADFLVTGHIPCERGYDMPSERHLILDSLGSPAAYALLPANRPLEPGEIERCVTLL